MHYLGNFGDYKFFWEKVYKVKCRVLCVCTLLHVCICVHIQVYKCKCSPINHSVLCTGMNNLACSSSPSTLFERQSFFVNSCCAHWKKVARELMEYFLPLLYVLLWQIQSCRYGILAVWSTFSWILGVKTHVFRLVWQVLKQLSHVSSLKWVMKWAQKKPE